MAAPLHDDDEGHHCRVADEMISPVDYDDRRNEKAPAVEVETAQNIVETARHVDEMALAVDSSEAVVDNMMGGCRNFHDNLHLRSSPLHEVANTNSNLNICSHRCLNLVCRGFLHYLQENQDGEHDDERNHDVERG